jgi:phage gpG-like protein
MVRRFEDAIKISISAYNRNRVALPQKLGNEAVNHFKDSWRIQGWNDNVTSPWKSRKKTDAGRAILVKSGRLRRSFNMSPTLNRIVVINDTPYSVYHNYGTKRLPKRKFMGKSQTLDEKSGVLIMRMIKRALR